MHCAMQLPMPWLRETAYRMHCLAPRDSPHIRRLRILRYSKFWQNCG